MEKTKGIKKIVESVKQTFNNPSFTVKEQLGYAAGCFGNTMAQDMIGTFLIIFLTDYMGIAAKYITILMLVAQVMNALMDPVAGAMVDRTNTRFGQARPYVLLAPLPLSVTSILLFVVPNISMTARIVYVFVFYILFCMADTFYDMSLMTVSARMTTNPADRSSFYTVSSFATALGSMLPGGVTPILISMYAGYEQEIYLYGAILFSLIGFAVMIVPFNTLKEKNLAYTEPASVKINAKAILMNKPLLLSMLSKLLECFRQITFGGLIYLYKQTMGAYWLSTIVGVFSVTFSYIALAIVPFLCKKFSARTLLIGGYFYTGFFYLVLTFCGYSNVWIVGFMIAVSGATSGLLTTARKILVADSTEYMEWKTWKKLGTPVRSDGMVFAMNSLSNRLTSAIKDLLLPIGLVFIGYAEARTVGGFTMNIVQTEATLNGIFYLVTIPGILGNFLAGAVMFFDDYTGKKKERILKELDELHEQQRKDALEAENASAEV